MNDTQARVTRDDYLRRLDAAMSELPHGVAAEIRAGIVEELSGLSAAETESRIAALGDPLDIAREARDELPAAPVVVAAPAAVTASKPPVTRTRGFAIGAALTLSFGGILVPFVGWVVGAVLVMLSAMWRTWEKAVAILVPLAVIALVGIVGALFWATAPFSASSSSGDFSPPEDVVSNPLVPGVYDAAHLLIIVAVLLAVPASGLWLLWRMRGRGEH